MHPVIEKIVIRSFVLGLVFSTCAITTVTIEKDNLFHAVNAQCTKQAWEPGRASRRGYAYVVMEYRWDEKTYQHLDTFGPLDDNLRKREQPEDVQRAQDWLRQACKDRVINILYGQPSLAWSGDQRGWNSIVVNVGLRAWLLAAVASCFWTGIQWYRPKNKNTLTKEQK